MGSAEGLTDRSVIGRLKAYAGMLMIGHSLFSLPFALAALLYATGGRPGWRLLALVALAFLGARNAANALNRVIDRKIDAENPRTAGRHIPSGRVSAKEALVVAGAFFLLLCVSAALISPLCFFLIPIPAALMLLYSYLKRWTPLCHLALGITSAAAAAGGWIAARGRLDAYGILLAAANGAWVMGFDVVYQCLDSDWDRAHGLHSLPADLGAQESKVIAISLHVWTIVFLAAFGSLISASPVYWIGLGIIAILIAAEHAIAAAPSARRTLISAYRMNQAIGPAFLALACADIYLGRPL
jgi:4-hydroxybenzoate polyprenyltransferase